MTHHLVAKDVSTRRGECSVCGPVKIARAGNGWACGERTNATSREWKRRHPNRLRRDSANPHRLSFRIDRAAICSVCGPVDIVPWGRGWICQERARELGRVSQQKAPQGYCRDCQVADGTRVWLTSDGCPRCAEVDLNAELAKAAADRRLFAGAEDVTGLHIVGMADPYEMPDYESAVPGWRTLGARV